MVFASQLFIGQATAEPRLATRASAVSAVDKLRPEANAGRQELEAIALQVMLSPLMQSQQKGPFGSGSAGKYWQSMLAEQVARQIAANGQVRLLPVAKGSKSSATARPQPSRTAAFPKAASRNVDQASSTLAGWRTTVVHRPHLQSRGSLAGQSQAPMEDAR